MTVLSFVEQHVLLAVVRLLDRVQHGHLRAAFSCDVRSSAFTSFGKHEPP